MRKYCYSHLSRGKFTHKADQGKHSRQLIPFHLCNCNINFVAKHEVQKGVTPTKGTGIAYVNVRSEYRFRMKNIKHRKFTISVKCTP